jgi:hypothetical protein
MKCAAALQRAKAIKIEATAASVKMGTYVTIIISSYACQRASLHKKMSFAPAATTPKCLIQRRRVKCAASFQRAKAIKIEAPAASVKLDINVTIRTHPSACQRASLRKKMCFAWAAAINLSLTKRLRLFGAKNFHHAKEIKIEANAASVKTGMFLTSRKIQSCACQIAVVLTKEK